MNTKTKMKFLSDIEILKGKRNEDIEQETLLRAAKVTSYAVVGCFSKIAVFPLMKDQNREIIEMMSDNGANYQIVKFVSRRRSLS